MDCKCENCVRENCQDRTKQDDSRIVTCCSDYLERKMTKADRIRAMSDDELADAYECGFHCAKCSEGKKSQCDLDCTKHCLEWLKQPAEG